MPFASEQFDFILCTEVMEHVLGPDELMTEMHRVLTASGRLLITLPSMWGEHEIPYDFRRWTSYGAMKFARDNGFEIVEAEKESPGTEAWIKMGLAEVSASRGNAFVRLLAKAWIYASFVVLRRVLGVMMPRVFLTNLLVLKKSGGH